MLDRDQLKESLRIYICQELLKKADYELGDEQSLINGGLLDSFAITDIAVFVDENFGVYIPNEELDAEKMDTLNGIVTQILHWQEKPNES